MSEAPSKRDLLNQAFNARWDIPGYGCSMAKGFDQPETVNHISSPALLSLFFGSLFSHGMLSAQEAIIPQLKQLPDALGFGPAVLGRIYFVDVLFSQLGTHSHLDNEVLRLLYQLRPAVVNSLLRDDTLVTNAQHPLRRALNDLCSWGTGWERNLGKNGDTYFQHLHNMTTAASHWQNGEPLSDNYHEALASLNEFVLRYEQVEKRMGEAEAAASESASLRRKVQDSINRHVQQKQLPGVAIQFFHDSWRDVLYRILVMHKDNSSEWLNALELTAQIVHCLEPNTDDEQKSAQEKKQKTELISKVIPALKQLLVSAGYGQGRSYLFNDVMDQLKNVAMGKELERQIAPELCDLDVEGASAQLSSAITEQVKQLKTGQWFVFSKNGDKTKAKLSMINKDSNQYLFVNLLGAKKFIKTANDIGLAINSKKAQLLVPHKLLNTVLSLSVDQFLRKFQNAQQSSQQGTQQAAASPSKPLEDRRTSAQKALAEADKVKPRENTRPQQAITPQMLAAADRSKVELAVNSLNIGSWLSMKNRLGEQTPCKIAVIFASSGKIILVDKSGLKMGEYQAAQIVDQIMAGEASILEMGDSFDSSLTRVIQTLKKNQ